MAYGLYMSNCPGISNEEAVQGIITQLSQKSLQNRKTEKDLFARIKEIESDSVGSPQNTVHELQRDLAEIISKQEELYSSVAKSIAILTRMECKSQEEAKALVIIAMEDMEEVDMVIKYEITQRVLGNIKNEEAAGIWDKYKN
jgi:hypothetical protein